MQYLYRRSEKSKVAHVWLDVDTACRMWSTGGIVKRSRFTVSENYGARKVCVMCKSSMRDLCKL
jgi:hypothetical protein